VRIVLIAALLGGCTTLPDAPTEIRVPVPVPCLFAADLPAKPQFLTDSEMAKMSDADMIIALRADQLAYRGYVPLIDALIQGCAK
jgi:hypothetical protein